MTTTTLQFALDRETKNTLVYLELDANGTKPLLNDRGYPDLSLCIVGTLYLKKSSDLGKEKQKFLTLTLTAINAPPVL